MFRIRIRSRFGAAAICLLMGLITGSRAAGETTLLISTHNAAAGTGSGGGYTLASIVGEPAVGAMGDASHLITSGFPQPDPNQAAERVRLYLLGLSSDTLELDHNQDGALDIADLIFADLNP